MILELSGIAPIFLPLSFRSFPAALRHDTEETAFGVSLPRLIVGKRHCRVLALGNINSDATGFDITFRKLLCGDVLY